LKNSFTTICSEKRRALLPADTDERFGSIVDFAAQSAVQQCNPLRNKSVALAHQQGFVCF